MSPKIVYRGSIARWLPKDPAIIRKFHDDVLCNLVEMDLYIPCRTVDEKRFVVDEIRFVVDNKQCAVYGKRFTVDGKRFAFDGKQFAIGEKQITVDEKQITVDGKRITVDEKLFTIDEKQFSIAILELKNLIENDPEVFRDFHEMFEQVPDNLKGKGDERRITNYMELLAALNEIITRAPGYYHSDEQLAASIPMYTILAPFCNTEAGNRAFIRPQVNAALFRIFDQWSRLLVSPESRSVVVTTENGWLSPTALKVQEDRLGMPFQKAWVCNPDQDPIHWGFTSWDEFFVRRFKQGVRPVIEPGKPEFINNPCEAVTWQFVTDVQATDSFWIKGQPFYSLQHVLHYDPLATQFIGGSVFQAILSSLDYHRWHSPVDGRVVKAYTVPGSYFAAVPDDNHSDVDIILRSIIYETAVCTRAYIYIESDNLDIGLMCFVAVGLVEISTTKLGVRAGDRVKKGDEIGSFRFGGSTHLLVFRPETKLTLLPGPTDQQTARKVNELLFHVDNRPA